MLTKRGEGRGYSTKLGGRWYEGGVAYVEYICMKYELGERREAKSSCVAYGYCVYPIHKTSFNNAK